ncbi:HNH endonuclease family protein [Paenibacillus sp. IHBB 10380]|uniref:HNH endonuclease family protein n=1 Tax=Paenibacillus sp. IHBB 10380 TaxID=1566358 RepID=UPI0005D78289|nr:DUF262 domain-containing protein [Paenibacillus sp. IHBB 10380]AJS61184.1 hypothetical protein UB51_25200 [Paenibacillus sp. IHBB 10380]
MSGVNLDAMIPKDDFEIVEVTEDDRGGGNFTIRIMDMEVNGWFLATYRKPDFQRETVKWNKETICGLIENFLDEDLIPAIILWRSPSGIVFILDGAHRLSAFVAWVNDDYGDGPISKLFYNDSIPIRQRELAEKARKYVNKKIGPYSDYKRALSAKNNTGIKPVVYLRAKRMASRGFEFQWVRGDARKAEQAFIRINKKSVTISDSELVILETRKTPVTIAMRAILRGGTGFKYWGNFVEEVQKEIEALGDKAFLLLYTPPLEAHIRSLDRLPVAGNNYAQPSLHLLFETVKIIIEHFYPTDEEQQVLKFSEDEEGLKTVEVLKSCITTFKRINSNSTSSLGLHPAIYFYNHKTGRYQPTTFMSITSFILHLDEGGLLNSFIEVREDFEKFLVDYNYFIEQIVLKFGSQTRSVEHLKNFYLEIFNNLLLGHKVDDIPRYLLTSPEFSFLKSNNELNKRTGVNFSDNTKNAIYIKEALSNAMQCKICHSLIQPKASSFDHKIRISEGGIGDVENGQLAHPYCNSIYKN